MCVFAHYVLAAENTRWLIFLQVSALKLAPTGTRGPLASLFGVFDGHGGDGASKFVANHLHHLVSFVFVRISILLNVE